MSMEKVRMLFQAASEARRRMEWGKARTLFEVAFDAWDELRSRKTKLEMRSAPEAGLVAQQLKDTPPPQNVYGPWWITMPAPPTGTTPVKPQQVPTIPAPPHALSPAKAETATSGRAVREFDGGFKIYTRPKEGNLRRICTHCGASAHWMKEEASFKCRDSKCGMKHKLSEFGYDQARTWVKYNPVDEVKQ